MAPLLGLSHLACCVRASGVRAFERLSCVGSVAVFLVCFRFRSFTRRRARGRAGPAGGAGKVSPHRMHTVPPYLRPSSARTPIDTPDFPKYGISRNAKYAAVSNAQARMYRQVPRVSLRPRLVRARFSTVTIYRYRVYSREHCTSVRIFSFVPAPCLLGFGGAPGERVSGS